MRLLKSGIINRELLISKKPYSSHTPAPTLQDYSQMLNDIKLHNQQTSIVVDENFNIIDGHTRLKIAKELDTLKIKFTQYQFASEAEKIQFIDSKNIKRRHLNFWQKFKASIPKYEKLQKEAKTRQKKGTLASKEAKGKATEIASKEAGMSKPTFERSLYVDKHATNDQKEKLETNKTKITTLYSELKNKNRKLPNPKIPKGQYNVLEIDFPWGYQNQSIGRTGNGGAKNQYPTIPPKQILQNEVPKFLDIIADDAVLFMWVTTPLLNEIIQLQILEKLGFQYKTMITWRKIIPKNIFGGKGMGYWFRGETEHCLVGVKGNIKPFKCTLANIIQSTITKNSEKPLSSKELIEEATKNIPNRKMFEGYARRPRKNWTGFGNQLEVITF